MRQVTALIISKGEPIRGLPRPHGRSIRFSQTVRLNCPEIASEAKPGQFVMVKCGEECLLPRPFSIHQVISKADLVLYFAVLEGGKGTGWLSLRQAGDTVELLGPLGNGFSIYPSSHKLLLVAGGMGVASLYFLAEEAFKNGYSVTVMYGTAIENRYPTDNLSPGIKTVIATEDGSVGYYGLVTDLLPDYIDQADQVFACGPLGMYKEMYAQREKLLKGRPTQISLEIRMACGLGACYGCSIKTKNGLKQVCKDGPVFNLEDILWDELSPV